MIGSMVSNFTYFIFLLVEPCIYAFNLKDPFLAETPFQQDLDFICLHVVNVVFILLFLIVSSVDGSW